MPGPAATVDRPTGSRRRPTSHERWSAALYTLHGARLEVRSAFECDTDVWLYTLQMADVRSLLSINSYLS